MARALFRLTTARLVGLAGMFTLPLLAGCAYDDSYYSSRPYGGYGYPYDYGYGGYGGYGYYGNPCWPYGCDDYHHRHHHWDDDDDNDGHHGHRGSGMTDGAPPRPPIAGNQPPSQPGPGPGSGRKPPPTPYPYWYQQQKDSKN